MKPERKNIEAQRQSERDWLQLTAREDRFICDNWLADVPIECIITAMYRDTMGLWNPQQQARKAVAFRHRYIMLDSAEISQKLDERFLGGTEDEIEEIEDFQPRREIRQ